MVNNRKKEIEFEDKEISKNSEIDIMNKNISNENIQHSEDINIVDDETNKDIHISSPNNNEDSNNINIEHIDNINESNDTPNISNKSEHHSTPHNKSEPKSLNHSDDDYYGSRSCLEPLDIEKIMKMGQDASYIRHTMTENDISRYAREYAEMEEQEEDEKYTPMDVLEVNDNNNLQETPIKNVSHISEVSKSKENSEYHKLNSKKKTNDYKFPSNDIKKDNTGSYISYHKDTDEKMYNEYGDEEFKQITDNSIHSAISMPQQKQKMNLTESHS